MEALGVGKAEADAIDDNIRDIRRKESVFSDGEDVIIVSLKEYARLEECTKNPARPDASSSGGSGIAAQPAAASRSRR